jgi:hypothetical protein
MQLAVVLSRKRHYLAASLRLLELGLTARGVFHCAFRREPARHIPIRRSPSSCAEIVFRPVRALMELRVRTNSAEISFPARTK